MEAATLRSAMMDLVRTSCSAFSHMGSNTACGHYVCHIKKGGRWVLFNDAKVAASESTPLCTWAIHLLLRAEGLIRPRPVSRDAPPRAPRG